MAEFAYAVHDGETWVCVERALESDELKPIPGFTRDSYFSDYMHEQAEWWEKATELMRDMWDALFKASVVGYVTVSTFKGFEDRLREFGIGEES